MAVADRTERFDVPIEKFYRAVADFEAYPLFVTGIKGARVLKGESGSPLSSELDIELDLEMIKRFDYSIRAKRWLDVDKGLGEVAWSLIRSQEMKVNNGRWRLKRLNPFQTEVQYELELELAFSVPSFVMKGLLSKALPQAMKEFSERARLVSSFT